MKHITLSLIIILSTLSNLSAQYSKAYNEAKRYEKKGEYYRAIQFYNAANVSRDKPSANNIDKRIDFCANQLNKLKLKAENALAEAEKQKQKSDSLLIVANAALKKAEKMQTKVETAMFDKAVKEQNKEWRGYVNYTDKDDRKKNLEKIDTLDLSACALLRLPKEIADCKNLKSLNLLKNKDINWNGCFKKLSACKQLTELKVSVEDLTYIDSVFWKCITGIEITKKGLKNIPQNILKQKQLTYLDISGKWIKKKYF